MDILNPGETEKKKKKKKKKKDKTVLSKINLEFTEIP